MQILWNLLNSDAGNSSPDRGKHWLAFNCDAMDIDWNEVPINGRNWYMKIPNIFVEEVGIKERDVTLGSMLCAYQRLRISSEEDLEKSQAELEKATELSNELILMEAKYWSAAAEAEAEVKLLQRDSCTLRVELVTIRGMNESRIENSRESKQARIRAEEEETRLNEEISSGHTELKTNLNMVNSLQSTLGAEKEKTKYLFRSIETAAFGLWFADKPEAKFYLDAFLQFLRKSGRAAQEEIAELNLRLWQSPKDRSTMTGLDEFLAGWSLRGSAVFLY